VVRQIEEQSFDAIIDQANVAESIANRDGRVREWPEWAGVLAYAARQVMKRSSRSND
jgi:hypothetical protein